MTVRARCPIHELELTPKSCAGCSGAIIVADMLNGVEAPVAEPKKTFVDTRGMRPDGSGIIVWNQRLDDDLDDDA